MFGVVEKAKVKKQQIKIHREIPHLVRNDDQKISTKQTQRQKQSRSLVFWSAAGLQPNAPCQQRRHRLGWHRWWVVGVRKITGLGCWWNGILLMEKKCLPALASAGFLFLGTLHEECGGDWQRESPGLMRRPGLQVQHKNGGTHLYET